MPSMTITITDVPTFAAVPIGYSFTGKISLPEVINGPIQINSGQLHYHYGRVYMSGPYLKAVCGDTTFRTDVISAAVDKTARLRNPQAIGWVAGTDHILRQNGRTITFTVDRAVSTSNNVLDRPYSADMTLDINYTLLYEKSPFTLSASALDLGQALTVNVGSNAVNGAFTHKATLTLGGLTITGSRTGPGAITLAVPRTYDWLAAIPDATQKTATVTLTTTGNGQTGTESKSVVLNVPADIVPAVGSVSVARIDGRVPESWGLFLKGESAARISIDDASPGAGSTIQSYRISGAGFAADAQTLITGKIQAAGQVTFTATVTDKRGRTGSKQVAIEVQDYHLPRLTGLTIERCDEYGVAVDDGLYMTGSAGFAITEIADNAPIFKLYTNGVLITPTVQSVEEVYHFQAAGPFDTVKSYDITLEVYDAVTIASAAPGSLTEKLPSATTWLDGLWDEDQQDYGAAFGGYAQQAKRLSIPEDWAFYRGEEGQSIHIGADDPKEGDSVWIDTGATGAPGGGGGGGSGVSGSVSYGIGDVFISANATSPAARFGGTWEQIKDKFLLAAGDTYTAGSTGGEATHKLTKGEMPHHTHPLPVTTGSGLLTIPEWAIRLTDGSWISQGTVLNNVNAGVSAGTGESLAHNNMPPYEVFYAWKRVA